MVKMQSTVLLKPVASLCFKGLTNEFGVLIRHALEQAGVSDVRSRSDLLQGLLL